MSDSENKKIWWPYLGWVIGVVMVIMWFVGSIKESTMMAWYIFAICGNGFTIFTSIKYKILWVIASMLLADFLFYVVIELDAPCAMNPWLLYGTLYGMYLAGIITYYLMYRKERLSILMLTLLFTLLNGVFLSLDMGWLTF